MAYTKQTFTSGQTLKASDLNTMSEGITTKQDKLVSGMSIKTLNGQSLLGSGDFDQRKQYGKYACIGDDISYGAFSSTKETGWCDYLAEKLGATLQKRASNGMKIHAHMRTQLEGIKADTELVTIMMGVNDAYAYESNAIAGLELGNVATVINMENDYPDDYTKSALYANGLNVLGVFRWCLERLKRKLPNARIVVIAPLPNKTRKETVFNTVVTGEIAICNALGVEVYAPGSDVLFDPTYFQNLYADGLHPNDAGYKVIAGWVYQRLGDVKQYEQVGDVKQYEQVGDVKQYEQVGDVTGVIATDDVTGVIATDDVTGVIATDDGDDSGSTDQTATPYPAELGDSSLMTL